MSNQYLLLDLIHYPTDLKKLNADQLTQVCAELRAFLIETILTNGGHFAANLGVVELTVALHYVFDTPNDKLVWDVGHQAYGHKILTGRKDAFYTNRKKDGLSGFPKISESIYDAFGTGHSSTAISAVLGMATVSKLEGNSARNHIAVVGDGALSAGQAFEGLNNLPDSGTNTLIILNDNNIGIDASTGAINRHLNSIEPTNNLFTQFGIPYTGPADGHDVLELIKILKELKSQTFPRILHIRTVKGKGFPEAEKEQTKWHSTSKFVKIEGSENTTISHQLKYQDVFGLTLKELAAVYPKIAGVTPAMPTGSGMIKAMEAFPDRFFDVGIAEQHAVTFAAGMATQGFVVFCSLYSTFLQRAYDQVIHDVCLQNLKVIFCIDRAGNVGDDGPTHHGMYDLSMFNPLPNITVLAPSTGAQLREMMHYYAKNAQGPVAIRYPKGIIDGPEINWLELPQNLSQPTVEQVIAGESIAILSVGNMRHTSIEAIHLLNEKSIFPSLYDIKIIKPLETEFLKQICQKYSKVITIEDGSLSGGYGEAVQAFIQSCDYKVKVYSLGFPVEIVEHASTREIFEKYGMDANGVFKMVLNTLI